MKCNSCVHNCNRLSQTTMGTIDELQGIQKLVFNEPVPIPTPLCKSHYHLVYTCMTHCNPDVNTVELVADAYDWETIGPVYNHMSFRHIYPSTF